MAKSVRDVDVEKVTDTKEDIDTLLVFVSARPMLRAKPHGEHVYVTGRPVLRRRHDLCSRQLQQPHSRQHRRACLPHAPVYRPELYPR